MPPADPVPRSECKYEGPCPAGPLSVIGSRDTIDLLAGHSRKLPHIDPTGREMPISCGAALSGLPSAIREMGNLPDAQLLPEPAQTDLLAQVPRQAVPGPYGRGKLAPLLSLFTADGVTRQRHDRACLPSSPTGPDRSPVPAAQMPRQIPAMPGTPAARSRREQPAPPCLPVRGPSSPAAAVPLYRLRRPAEGPIRRDAGLWRALP